MYLCYVERTIVFGNDAGVCLSGHVMLRHEDVADNWIVVRATFTYALVLPCPGHGALITRNIVPYID